MDKTDIAALRRLLKKHQRQKEPQCRYEWQVQVHRPVEQILAIIQNRQNPRYEPPVEEPYTVTANFTTLEEARSYALLVTIRGLNCTIRNNWTGAEHAE
jgi:hypothetical protein